jgi:hypothetical protein
MGTAQLSFEADREVDRHRKLHHRIWRHRKLHHRNRKSWTGIDSNLIISFCRLEITTESFISPAFNPWNRLDQSDRNLDTLTKFKKAIRREQLDNTKRIPKHFYYGPRKLNIIHTQLRNSYSFLNYDLSKVNIVNDASCSCGSPRENAYPYLFTCPNYAK